MCRLDAAHGRAPAGTGGVRVPDWRGLLPRNRRSASRVRLSSIAAVEAQPEPTQRISSPIACCIPRRAGFVTAVAIGAQKPRVLPAARIPPSFSCLADCSQPVLQDISYSSPVPEQKASRRTARLGIGAGGCGPCGPRCPLPGAWPLRLAPRALLAARPRQSYRGYSLQESASRTANASPALVIEDDSGGRPPRASQVDRDGDLDAVDRVRGIACRRQGLRVAGGHTELREEILADGARNDLGVAVHVIVPVNRIRTSRVEPGGHCKLVELACVCEAQPHPSPIHELESGRWH